MEHLLKPLQPIEKVVVEVFLKFFPNFVALKASSRSCYPCSDPNNLHWFLDYYNRPHWFKSFPSSPLASILGILISWLDDVAFSLPAY